MSDVISGVMDPRNVDNKKQTQGIRRPFGVAGMYMQNMNITLDVHGIVFIKTFLSKCCQCTLCLAQVTLKLLTFIDALETFTIGFGAKLNAEDSSNLTLLFRLN